MYKISENLLSSNKIPIPPKFNPEKGKTILEPENLGFGYWIGGHSITYDEESSKFYLYCRKRSPLGKKRGHTCIIAESNDGTEFTTIWEATKNQLNASSIEVGSLIKDPTTRKWRLYLSYEKVNGPWHIDLLEADHPKNFDAWHHRTVMEPGDFGLTFMKDPKVYIRNKIYHAFVNVNSRKRYGETEDGIRFPIGDDATALLTSKDGYHFLNLQYVFEPKQSEAGKWGLFRARITSIIEFPQGHIGFTDVGTSTYDSYEEWSSLAFSQDLKHWERLDTDEPWVRSKYGCIRYIDAIRVGDEILYYYEYTREDGSHELRMNKASFS
jgi:hypothetical protein